MNEVRWKHLTSNFSDEELKFEVSEDFDDDMDGITGSFDMLGNGYEDLDFTPMGVFHKRDTMNPMKHYDFWIGYTNFRLTEVERNIIASSEGVDIFHQFAPYRFLVAPGELFEWDDVKKTITNNLLGDSLVIDSFILNSPEEADSLLDDFHSSLDADFNYWILYTVDDGPDLSCVYVGCNKPDNADFKQIINACNPDMVKRLDLSKSIAENEFYKKDM